MSEINAINCSSLSNPNIENLFASISDKTVQFYEEIAHTNPLYTQALSVLQNGDVSVELKKKYILKAIDETWVQAVEDSLVALDNQIRNPVRFIEEEEEVLPIELSRNINDRSLRHLAQHTDYIQKVEGETITPSKILNVFHDETMMTYENKFVNTLINRLYIFVSRRYAVAKEQGQDEKSSIFNFTGEFTHDKIKGKIHFNVEISEKPDLEKKNPYVLSTPLWRRVERLYNIVESYMSSDFTRAMGKNYIRPPVMRTNAILKNKNLRQCLALWEFIESYNDTGYGMLIQENAEKVDDAYLSEICSSLALQYVLFRHNIKNNFVPENEINSEMTQTSITPRFVSDIKKIEESEFNVFDTEYMKMVPVFQVKSRRKLSKSERDIMEAIDVILAVLPKWDEQVLAEEAMRRAKEEALRIAAEEEAKRKVEEEAARRAAEEAEELARKKAERAAARRERRKRKKQETARIEAMNKAKRAADEQRASLAVEEQTRTQAETEAAAQMLTESITQETVLIDEKYTETRKSIGMKIRRLLTLVGKRMKLSVESDQKDKKNK